MTSQDVRTFETSLQSVMDATADIIDIFSKVAAECAAHAKEIDEQLS